ncbi:uncharacterized protein LOC135710384 [Ochlerotatus camptorhynchus]|uniref:uncharacterized protein LOC135710384 n=1 Tax=Ochlerotatus camptorhynchus TaxID=644619 RepID=UPI0031E012AC
MRIRDSSYFLLLSRYLGITLLIAHGSSQTTDGSEIPCRDGGLCVPFYMCSNSKIITDGTGLIDLRFTGEDCPDKLICCQDTAAVGSRISECQGKCVPLSQCLDDVYEDTVVENSVLDIGKTSCSDNQICCNNVRQPQFTNMIVSPYKQCQGKCVPFYQCSGGKLNSFGKDIINLRSTDDGCGGDELVCCMETDIKKPNIELPKLCDGTCVPFYQCSNGSFNSAGEGVINLRSFDNACPGEQVCCSSKPMPNIEVPKLCDGTCVPFYQCSNGSFNSAGEGVINLRSFDDACPGELVCCSSKPMPNIEVPKLCDGTCVPFYQCSNGSFNSAGEGVINLRSFDNACPGEQVCCSSKPMPNIEVPKLCDGTCVPFYQCSNGSFNSAGEGVINLRSFDDACPGELVCCSSKPKPHVEGPKLCVGTCVPFYQCSNGSFSSAGEGVINLRSFDDACPGELVCCGSKPKPHIEGPKLCGGTCVPFYQCSNGSFNSVGEGVINLRSFDDACPGELVCCSSKSKPHVKGPKFCDGTCVPFYQCSNGSFNTAGEGVINLRSFDDACPGELVCCSSKPKPHVETPKLCDGTCVPFYQCSNGSFNSAGEGVINLRSFDDACPGELVCCSSKSKPHVKGPKFCDGTCVPFYQCSNGSFNTAGEGVINLRSFDNACPGELVCCTSKPMLNIEVPKLCDGTCVPFYQCSNGTFNSAGEGVINLRSFDDACPGELVCCGSKPKPHIEGPKLCGGTCVPFYQCSNGSFSSAGEGVINLRNFDDACPGELVCCSSEPEVIASTCQCVPFNQCLDGTANMSGKNLLDLRSTNQDCPGNQVCCSNPRPSHMETANSNECKGTCVPFYQCLNGKFNTGGKDILDLRLNNCPGDLVCCEAPTVPKIPDKRVCEGACVPIRQCNTAGKDILNLRSYYDCPGDQICCELSAKVKQTSKLCDGKCVPPAQCSDSPSTMVTQLIDARLGLTYTGCLDGNVCCANPIRMTPDADKWMDWINDINNMVVAQNVKKTGKCSLDIVRGVESIKENEIPWLVTVWRRNHRLGVMHDEYLCAGTLVRADVVFVPADCIQGDPNARLFVRTGSYNLKAMSGYKELQIIRKIIHPDYDNAYNPNNAALLFLPERSKNKPHEACIFGIKEQLREQDCLIAGWNSLDLRDVRNPFTMPKKLYSPIVRTTTCRPGSFCTGRNQFIESCDRLHGSPVICLDQSGHNWKIAGMVVKNNVRCDQNGIPDSLLEVTRLEPWIREQLSPSFVQKPAVHEPSRKYLPVK